MTEDEVGKIILKCLFSIKKDVMTPSVVRYFVRVDRNVQTTRIFKTSLISGAVPSYTILKFTINMQTY